MADISHPLHCSLVRIRDVKGDVVGAGFLATPNLVCTCAHVVADALVISRETELLPEHEVHLDFPFLGGAEGIACVHIWVRMEPGDGGGDIAILRLKTDLPPTAQSARMLPVSPLAGKAFMACGFPSMADMGQYAYGILRNQIANGYVQLEGEATQGYRVQKGYSGTPIWDQRGRGVVGMVVMEDQNPKAKVAFLIPNDLIFHACSEIKPIALHQLFAPLTGGLAGLPGSPLSGVEQFLHEYLGTSDSLAPFGGRQAQLAALDRWLDAPEQPYALLVAEAGRGKSALLAQWVAGVADEQCADVAFVPISIRFSTSLKSTAISLLGARLRYLHSVKADPPRDIDGWLAEIEVYLREDRSSDRPLLIVLDGADEATDWDVGLDLRFPPKPGCGVKVLVSARSLADCDAEGWLRRLEWLKGEMRVELPPLDQAGVAEVLQSMGNPLADLVTQVDVVRELHRLSEGDPLLVRLYVEALRGTGERVAFLTPEELQPTPPGLKAYFERWWHYQGWQWEMQGRDVGSEQEDIMDFFKLCSIALGPLLRDEIAAITGGRLKSGTRLRRIANEAGRFIIGDGSSQGYTFSHPRLGVYFCEEQMIEEERLEWEQRILNFGQRTLEALNSGKVDSRRVSPYAVRYYGAHLERAGASPECFNDMICQEWQRAWLALEGSYDGFLNDLMRAWKRVDVAGIHAQSTEERAQAISWQCRYALLATSINTLANNIHPALLKELVDRKMWTPIQGLAYARRIPDGFRQVSALAGLAPYLPTLLHQEALEAARIIRNKENKVRALARLIPYLSRPFQVVVVQEAQEYAQAITNQQDKMWALIDLAPYLSVSLLEEVLEYAQYHASEGDRHWMLIRLVPYLPESLQEEAQQALLNIARTVTDKYDKVRKLVKFAPHLPKPLQEVALQEAQEYARAIDDKEKQVRAMAELASYLSTPLLQKALNATLSVSNEKDRVWALTKLIPHLPPSLRDTAIQDALTATRAITDEKDRVWALIELTPYLPPSSQDIAIQDVLTATRTIKDLENRVGALMKLVPFLSASLQEKEIQRTLEAAHIIADEYDQAQVMVSIASHLPTSLLQEALETIHAMADESHKSQTMVGLASHLPSALLQKALETLQIITNDSNRVEALIGLAPHLPLPLLQKALEIACVIPDDDDRAKALIGLAPHLPLPLLQKALEIACVIPDDDDRAKALIGLAPYLPLPLRQIALEIVCAITNDDYKASRLVELAPHLPPLLLQEAIKAIQAIAEEDEREIMLIKSGTLSNEESWIVWYFADEHERVAARALAALAPYLSVPLLQEALKMVQAISSGESQAKVLVGLARHLPLPLLQEALKMAQAISSEKSRAQALVGLAPHLPASFLQEGLKAVQAIDDEYYCIWGLVRLAPHLSEPLQKAALQEALEVAQNFKHKYYLAEALVELAPYLPITLLQKALETTRAITYESHRTARLLVQLAPHLPVSLLQEALEAAQSINGYYSSEAIIGLAPYLPVSLLQEALETVQTITVRSISEGYDGSELIIGLAPYLPIPLLQKALKATHAIASEDKQAEALIGLAPHLPAPLLQEALETARAIAHARDRTMALAGLAPYMRRLSAAELYPLWCETLHIFVTHTRSDLLHDIKALSPIIEILGGLETLISIARIIREVRKWFP